MKVKLSVSQGRYQELEAELRKHGIEIDDTAELVLCERNRYTDNLLVKDGSTQERIRLSTEEIVSIEAWGRVVEIYTQDRTYQTKERLYKIEALLNPDRFLRISQSVVIARDKVKAITPTLSMKFVLTMVNGRKVDVTRSYYYIFKEYFGI